jgi:hypothetical protein
MNSKKLSLALLFIIIASISVSQKNTGKFILFKLYKSAVFDLGQTQATRTVTVGTFNPAIAWGEAANFHEIQITSLSFASRAQTFLYSGGAEYTYNHQFSDDEDSKFNYFFGGGFGAGFSTKNSSLVNANSVTIPTIGKFININLIAIPRLTYDILNNIALELSLSYSILDFEYSKQTAADPSLPLNSQTNVYNELKYFPSKFTLRLGGIIRF